MTVETEEELWHETIDNPEQSEGAGSEEQSEQKPDPYESLKSEFESLKTQLPSEEEREILGALRGLRQPKEQKPSEAEEKLAAALETLKTKGVLTQDNPEVARVLKIVERYEKAEQERVTSALGAEGYQGGIPHFESEVSATFYRLDQQQQKDLAKHLQPYYTKEEGLVDPIGAAKAFNAYKQRLEGATPPSKSIDNSIKGQASTGIQTSSKPDRATFFRDVYPKLTPEQKQRVMSGQSKPYSDY